MALRVTEQMPSLLVVHLPARVGDFCEMGQHHSKRVSHTHLRLRFEVTSSISARLPAPTWTLL